MFRDVVLVASNVNGLGVGMDELVELGVQELVQVFCSGVELEPLLVDGLSDAFDTGRLKPGLDCGDGVFVRGEEVDDFVLGVVLAVARGGMVGTVEKEEDVLVHAY